MLSFWLVSFATFFFFVNSTTLPTVSIISCYVPFLALNIYGFCSVFFLYSLTSFSFLTDFISDSFMALFLFWFCSFNRFLSYLIRFLFWLWWFAFFWFGSLFGCIPFLAKFLVLFLVLLSSSVSYLALFLFVSDYLFLFWGVYFFIGSVPLVVLFPFCLNFFSRTLI